MGWGGMGEGRMDGVFKGTEEGKTVFGGKTYCSQIKNLIFADDGLEMSTCQRHCNLSS